MARRLAAFFLSLFAVGCALGPNYKRPDVPVPPAWRELPAAEADTLANTPWWVLFDDPTLQELVRIALQENKDLEIAVERIEEALGTGPDTISTACPYCLVMLVDAISAKKSSGEASESLEIVDVVQLLARSVQPAAVAAASPGNGSAPAGAPSADGESPEASGSPASGSPAGGSPSGDGQPSASPPAG